MSRLRHAPIIAYALPLLFFAAALIVHVAQPEWGAAATLLTAALAFLAGLFLMSALRRRHEAELGATRWNEERFRSLVTATAPSVWWTTPDGDRVEPLSGEGPFGLEGVHPDDRQATAAAWERARKTGEICEVRHRRRRRDGRYRMFLARLVPIKNVRGRVVEWVGTSADITDQVEAEQALREHADLLRASEQRLRAAYENAPVGISEVWLDGSFAAVNRRFCELTGYSREELLARGIADITHRDDREEDLAQFARVVKGEIPQYALEKRYLRKDGGVVWVELVVSVLRDAEGKPWRGIGIANDVTERKRVEDKLRTRRQQLRVTLASIGDAVVVTTAEGRVAFLNPAAERLTGWTRRDATRRPLEEVFRLVDQTTRWPAEAPVRQALKGGSGVGLSGHSVLLTRDGREVPVEDNSAPINEPSGRVGGAVLVFRDVTDRRKAQEALRERERFIQRVLDTTPEIVSVFDLVEERTTFINGQVKRALGVTPDEVCTMGRAFFERFWHTDDQARWQALTDRFSAARDGEILESEYRMRHADGTWHWFANREMVFTRNPDGTPRQVLGVTTDITARRRAEEALRREEERYRQLVELLPVGVYAVDKKGVITFCNQRAAELWGRSPGPDDHFTGALNVYLPDGTPIPPERTSMREAVRSGLAFRATEALVERPDGSRIVVEVNIDPVRDATGKVVGAVNVFQDVTDRKRAEEQLREGEERLRLALDAGRCGIWDWDVINDRVVWSDRIYEFHGLAHGQFEGKFGDFEGFVHLDDLPRVREALRRALEERADYQIEFRIARPDGEVRWLATSGRVIFDPAGRPVRMLGATIDVTERRRGEERNRFLAEFAAPLAAVVPEYEATLRSIARLMVPPLADYCIVFLVSDDGELRQVAEAHSNPAKNDLLHRLAREYRPTHNAKSRVGEVIRSGRPDFLPDVRSSILETIAPDEATLEIFRNLGPRSWMTVPLVARGRNLGCLHLAYAASGRRYTINDLAFVVELARRAALAVDNARLYAEVREADRRKDEFLAVLAHELRNPLAPVTNALRILRIAGSDPEAASESLEMMERQVSHLVRLVDDLLDVARITKGKIVLDKQPVELAAAVRSAVESSRPLVEAKGHTLTVDLPPAPVWLEADLTRLAQIIANLLNNSARYTPPGGTIVVSASVDGASAPSTMAEIHVRDNGVGIPSEHLPLIFDMFAQADRPLERTQGGLGIGLTLVRRLVEMHGGTVEASSGGAGQGAEFIVRLPIAANVEREVRKERLADAPRSALRSSHSLKVLVVDDNRDAADSLGKLLRLTGCEVCVAYDGRSALEQARSSRPRVLFVDLGMPGMDGFAVAREVRGDPELNSAVLVALTGWGQPEDRRRSADAGFDHHLTKPANPTTLEGLLGTVTER